MSLGWVVPAARCLCVRQRDRLQAAVAVACGGATGLWRCLTVVAPDAQRRSRQQVQTNLALPPAARLQKQDAPAGVMTALEACSPGVPVADWGREGCWRR